MKKPRSKLKARPSEDVKSQEVRNNKIMIMIMIMIMIGAEQSI